MVDVQRRSGLVEMPAERCPYTVSGWLKDHETRSAAAHIQRVVLEHAPGTHIRIFPGYHDRFVVRATRDREELLRIVAIALFNQGIYAHAEIGRCASTLVEDLDKAPVEPRWRPLAAALGLIEPLASLSGIHRNADVVF